MTRKIGVYICSGCGIGDALDLDAAAKTASEACPGSLGKQHEALCGPEGLKLIQDDLDSGEVNTLLVAACSPRVKEDEFSFDKASYVERVNLREHVAWSKPADGDDEDTNLLAQDYVRMACAKLGKIEDIQPYDVGTIDRTILVVGGGLTGLTAAVEVARTGYDAIIVEKEAELGGLMAQCHKRYPTAAPYEALQDTGIAALVKQVEASARITVHTRTMIQKIEGAPGLFDVTLDGADSALRVGAIIQATGAVPYDAGKLGHLGYGESADVVTSLELEAMAKKGAIIRPSDGKPAKKVAFVQCAGSRDEEHLSYCSGHCCLTSLKQAQYLREQDKDAQAFILYRDMRTPGHYEDFYRSAQNDDGIFLTKGDVVGVKDSGGQVRVDVDNALVGDAVSLDVDLVVLATGLVTSMATASDEEPILGLDYRQGPDLPELVDDFPDSHFICFPYETRRTGIYAAGTVRHPMDGGRSQNDAAGAALKAIQCVEMTSRSEAVHPRSGEITFPDFFLQRCTQCKRCTEECPFGTLNEDPKGTPQPNPTRCRRCGICMGACPERIISFADYSVDIIGSMIKSIHVPDEFEEKPRIICLCCENDAYPALDIAAKNGEAFSPWVRFIPVRCLGSVNIVWIADALSRGIDAIMMLGCRYGDDYQCHYVRGSELCNTRIGNVQDTLERLMLERDRIRIEQVQLSDWDKIPALVNGFADEVEEMDANPYKDM